MTVEELVAKILILTKQSQYAKTHITEFVEMGIQEMLAAGVDENVAHSQKALGFLCAFCTDMDNQNSGEIKLSNYTKTKLAQLTLLKPSSESIKYGVLFVDFDCEDSITATLNIIKDNELKHTYQITNAIVEILPVGDYEVEIILPDEYEQAEKELISISENNVIKVYKEIKNDNIPVVFSLKNKDNENLSGYIFKFINTETNENIGEFMTDKTDKIIKIPEGHYLVTPVYIPAYSNMIDDVYVDVVKGSDNVIEIIKEYDNLVGSNTTFNINSVSINNNLFGTGSALNGVIYIRNCFTNEIIQKYDCRTPKQVSYIYGNKNIDYQFEFIPDNELVLPLNETFKLGSTKAYKLNTVENAGIFRLSPMIGLNSISNTNGSDIEEYTVTFTNTKTSETFTYTFKTKYYPTGSTTQSTCVYQYSVLPAGTYTITVDNINSTKDSYRMKDSVVATVNSQKYSAVTLTFEKV